MLYEIQSDQFESVRPLVAGLRFQPFCTVVLAGLRSGRVFVDNREHPKTTFVSRDDSWCFLAGKADNSAFNHALNQAIFERSVVPSTVPVLSLTCDSKDWNNSIDAILAPYPPASVTRRHYVCHTATFDWRAHLPTGFTVQQMSDAVFSRSALHIPDEIRGTWEQWRQNTHPDFRDFGFVAIHEDPDAPAIASWATVDAVVDGVGDAGLFTVDAYRRRGLAVATTGAALEYGLAHGLSEISWTCAEDNLGSIRTAEKLGLERQSDYTFYYFAFDRVEHLSLAGYAHLQAGRYQAAAEMLEQCLALNADLPCYVDFDAARARAGIGDRARVLEHLNHAIDKGWTYVEPLITGKEFETVRTMPEWEALLARIQ
jgi:RimJ/RimL family protein N-acetyltransferase